MHACRDRAAKDTENAIQQAHEDNHSGKAMEVLLARAQARGGAAFCEGLPLVPTLDEVTKMLAKERRREEALAAGEVMHEDGPARRQRATVTDARGADDDTFFLGKGENMRLSNAQTKPAMNAVGFFLYTQCAGNTGDKWPDTMGAYGSLLIAHTYIKGVLGM